MPGPRGKRVRRARGASGAHFTDPPHPPARSRGSGSIPAHSRSAAAPAAGLPIVGNTTRLRRGARARTGPVPDAGRAHARGAAPGLRWLPVAGVRDNGPLAAMADALRIAAGRRRCGRRSITGVEASRRGTPWGP